jgi:hypothetical protein
LPSKGIGVESERRINVQQAKQDSADRKGQEMAKPKQETWRRRDGKADCVFDSACG